MGESVSETRNDAVQRLRELWNIALDPDEWTGLGEGPNRSTNGIRLAFSGERSDAFAVALDRIEAVVNAARLIDELAHPMFVRALRESLASLTQETPAQEERT